MGSRKKCPYSTFFLATNFFELMDKKKAFPAHSYVVGNPSLNFNVREDLRSDSNETLFIAYTSFLEIFNKI